MLHKTTAEPAFPQLHMDVFQERAHAMPQNNFSQISEDGEHTVSFPTAIEWNKKSQSKWKPE